MVSGGVSGQPLTLATSDRYGAEQEAPERQGRVVSKDLTTSRRPVAVPQLGPEARMVLDVALGAAGLAVGTAVVAARTVHRVTAPLTRMLWRPPLVPTRYHPATVVGELARTGGIDREELTRQVEALLDVWAPAIVAMVVERLDLTRLVEENVDLDGLVATVDLDAAVALVDLDAAVARVDIGAVIDRVDLDAIVATVDLDAAVARVDIGAVIDRVDLDAIVATVDLDAAVARVDIGAVIDRVDLDAIVATVDLDGAVARVDLDAIIDRIDVIGIVEEVLDVIDLPAIIRDSTGSMASETVRGARMTSITADDAITRAVDRALFRRRKAPVAGSSNGTPGTGS